MTTNLVALQSARPVGGLSVIGWNRALDAAFDYLDGGVLHIYSAQPAACTSVTVVSQPPLVIFQLGTPCWKPAVVQSGVPRWFCAFARDGHGVYDGTASVGEPGVEMMFDEAFVEGKVVALTTWSFQR